MPHDPKRIRQRFHGELINKYGELINKFQLNPYIKEYTDEEIAANRNKVPKKPGWNDWEFMPTGQIRIKNNERKDVVYAMYDAAEYGKAAELLKLVEPWFAHPLLNDYTHYRRYTPLIIASIDGKDECVKILAAQPGIEINKVDDFFKRTALHWASKAGRIECVRALVVHPGIEINKGGDGNESTALLLASRFGHVDIVELLCSQPAIDVNKANMYGETPYSEACRQYKGDDKEERTMKIRAILEQKGAKKGGKRKRTYKKNPKKTKKDRSRKHK